MKFKIYYSKSGFGLVKDATILQDTLLALGHQVQIIECPLANKSINGRAIALFVRMAKIFGALFLYRRIQRFIFSKPRAVSIHLEKIFYGKLFFHEKHILIPNQEWFSPHSFSLLDYIDVIWTKTYFAQGIFSEFKKNTAYIGFCSISEVYEPTKKSKDYFFSRIGKGRFRGAKKLVDVWRHHPEWPVLKLVIDSSCRPDDCPKNVEYIDAFVHFEDYNRLSGSSLFHIYATEVEGFGHSINEALAQGAVVLVTNAPPMNEIANSDCALLIDAEYIGQKLFSPRFSVKDSALEGAVARAMMLEDGDINQISRKAIDRSQELRNNFITSLDFEIKKL
jgi:hypothetical protein